MKDIVTRYAIKLEILLKEDLVGIVSPNLHSSKDQKSENPMKMVRKYCLTIVSKKRKSQPYPEHYLKKLLKKII